MVDGDACVDVVVGSPIWLWFGLTVDADVVGGCGGFFFFSLLLFVVVVDLAGGWWWWLVATMASGCGGQRC